MKIVIINGPNLNMLKYRDSTSYGNKTLEDINLEVQSNFPDIDFEFFQSNHEGEIIDLIHDCILKNYEGIIINPGALAHYSYSIMDALEIFKGISVEVHLSDVLNRDDFRKVLITGKSCDKIISGRGYFSYIEAIRFILGEKL